MSQRPRLRFLWPLFVAVLSCARPAPPPREGERRGENGAHPLLDREVGVCPEVPPWEPSKGAPLVKDLVRSEHACPAGSIALPGGRLELRPEKRLSGPDRKTVTLPPEIVDVAPFCLDRTELPRSVFDPTAALSDDDARRPAEVTAQAAEDYCNRVGGRLPTEAEWVLAAIGLTGWAFPWGDWTPAADVCWRRSPRDATCAVGSSAADRSPEGVMDLAGNVREWARVEGPEGGVKRFGGGSADCFPSLVSANLRLGSPPTEGDLAGVRCVRVTLTWEL